MIRHGNHTLSPAVEEQLVEFRAWLQENGHKQARARDLVAGVILETGGARFCIDDVLKVARERRARIGYATVYRTVHLMAEAGFLQVYPPVVTTYEVTP